MRLVARTPRESYLCSVNTKTAVVIPVYRHSGRLGGVIEGVSEFLPRERILVVDDGSPAPMVPGGKTPRQLARDMGCRAMYHRRNLGKGAALRTGFDFWARYGMEWVLTLDADGQHDPAELEKFARFTKSGEADLVIGSRMGDLSSMPWDRRFSNRFSSLLLSLAAGQRIEDAQCGYRLVRLASIAGIDWREEGYVFESEMIVRLARRGRRIVFVPVRTIYAADQPSSINRVPETLRFLRMLVYSMVKP